MVGVIPYSDPNYCTSTQLELNLELDIRLANLQLVYSTHLIIAEIRN